ncbi:MAG: hypothetical protein PGN13_12660 [Patulibacter minatonensis]
MAERPHAVPTGRHRGGDDAPLRRWSQLTRARRLEIALHVLAGTAFLTSSATDGWRLMPLLLGAFWFVMAGLTIREGQPAGTTETDAEWRRELRRVAIIVAVLLVVVGVVIALA